jgi:hypothetical protein
MVYIFVVFLSIVFTVHAELEGGRALLNERSFTLELSGGLLKFEKGTIEETRRAYDNEGNVEDYKAYLSNYDLDELGFDDNYPSIGLFMEKQWKFITLQIDAEYVRATANATADMHPTASMVPDRARGYYIGVDSVSYNGRDYEYMFIPNGQDFDAEIKSAIAELKLLFTPFNIRGGESICISPWVHLGVMGVWGDYEIDAGPARGTVQYEVPPETYVIGGKGTGNNGGAIPEIGVGGEFRITMGAMRGGDAQLVFQGELGYLKYDGSTGDLGFDSRHEKNLDLTYYNMDLRIMMEFPVSPDYDIVLGASLEKVKAEADLDAIERSKEAQEELREKYDKHVELETTQMKIMAGIRF